MAKVIKAKKGYKVIHETNKTTLAIAKTKKEAQRKAREIRKRNS